MAFIIFNQGVTYLHFELPETFSVGDITQEHYTINQLK